MMQDSGEHYHGQHAAKRSPMPMIVAAIVALALAVALAVGIWHAATTHGKRAAQAGNAAV